MHVISFCRRQIFACIVFFLVLSSPALAHEIGISRGDYRADGSTLLAELTFARPEILVALPHLDSNQDGLLSDVEIKRGQGVLARRLLDGLRVRSESDACNGALSQATLTANDGLNLRLRYVCAPSATRFHVRMPLLASLTLGHRHLASLKSSSNATATTQVIFEAKPEFEVAASANTASNHVAGPLFLLGIEHILTGFDHLVFVLGVILIAGKKRSLILAITAFTVGHSLTLGLATLGFWAPSPAIIEPLIALSIVYIGIENWFAKDGSRRWLLTLPFGLIHGFGFAGALQEISLAQTQLPIALLTFNLGVEAGQLAVIAVLLPILVWLRQRRWFVQYGVRSASSLISVAGALWFVQRVF